MVHWTPTGIEPADYDDDDDYLTYLQRLKINDNNVRGRWYKPRRLTSLVLNPRNLYYRNGYSSQNCAPILHLNIDGAPKLKKYFYINYGVLNLRRQFFTSLT